MKSVCSNVKSNIVLPTVQPETNPFLNFKPENAVPLDVGMFSTSHPGNIMDQISSKATSSPLQVQSDDSETEVQSDDSETAVASQEVPTNFSGDGNSRKQVEAPSFCLNGGSSEEDNEKGPKLKFTK